MAATEINNSRACALTIKTRGGFSGMVPYIRSYALWLYTAYGNITTILIRTT
jgi:hypothetical protein